MSERMHEPVLASTAKDQQNTRRLMLSDEEVVRFAIGDCLLHLEKDRAEERLESTRKESKNDVKKIETEIADIKEQMKVRLRLKVASEGCVLI